MSIDLQLRSQLKVDLEGIDQRHQPSKQLLMNRMVVIGVERRAIRKLHHAAKLISLRTRRDIDPNEGFDEAGDLPLQGPNLLNNVLLLLIGDARFPAKGKCMDDHAASVYSTP